MKRPLLLFAVGLSVLFYHSAEAKNSIAYTARFETPDVNAPAQKQTAGKTFSSVSLAGCHSVGEVGAPGLPARTVSFLVPVYTGKFTVSAKWPGKPAFSAKLASPLKPVQKPFTTNEKFVATQPDEKAYSRTYQPGAYVVNDYFIDGSNHIVTVAVSPVRYDPVGGTLDVYDQVDLSLSYDDVDVSQMSSKPIFTEKPDPDLDLGSIVVNYSGPAKTIPSLDAPADSRGTYIIISTEELLPAFDELALWKKMKGYNVIRRSIESILSAAAYSGGDLISGINDDAGKMRAYLQDCYRKYGRSYVLIGGDNFNTNIPIRFGYWYNNLIGQSHFVPSDLYFSDMTGNWNSNENEYYGEPTGDNVNPYGDMAVGRLYCKNAQEVDNYTKKLILYECNPGLGDCSYLSKALVVRANDIPSPSNHQLYTTESHYALYRTFSSLTEWLADNNGKRYTGSQVINEMNKGYGLNIVDGHGQPRKINTYHDNETGNENSINAMESYLTHPEIDPGRGMDNLSNNLYPSIFYSVACDACPPDSFHPNYYRKGQFNMGSAYTTAGKYGGVAFYGNTRSGYSTESTKLQGYFSQILDKTKRWEEHINTGTLLNQSKYKFRNKNLTDVGYHVLLTHTLIGEPEMTILMDTPEILPIQTLMDQTSFNGSLSFSNYDLQDACFTVSDGQNVTECKYFEGMENVTVTLENLNNKTVTITKDGYKPISKLISNGLTVTDKREFFLTDSNIQHTISAFDGGHLVIRCTGKLVLNGGLEIGPRSCVEIICDGDIFITRGRLYTGGTLITRTRGSVFNYANFKIEPGSLFQRRSF